MLTQVLHCATVVAVAVYAHYMYVLRGLIGISKINLLKKFVPFEAWAVYNRNLCGLRHFRNRVAWY